jgi:hypothetical protein
VSALAAARELDAAGELLAAVSEYEKAIRSGEGDLEAYLDLAVLYFVLLDGGMISHLDLAQDFVDLAWSRANQLLDEAQERFGVNSEAEFWKRYLEFIVVGADLPLDEVRRLASCPGALTPVFHLFASSNGAAFPEEAERLYQSVRFGRTARDRYIKGIIEGVHKRRR